MLLETMKAAPAIFKKYHPFNFPSSRFYFSFDYGPVHVAVVDQYTSYTSGSAQYNWLVNDLSTSTKPWKIIVLHQPGWSCNGGHGNDGTVQSTIQPLCTQYKACKSFLAVTTIIIPAAVVSRSYII